MGKNTGRNSPIIALESNQSIGRRAEDAACAFLIKQGLRLITRNYLCRLGEIDLIMRDGLSLVFIEVRCRKPSVYGTAAQTVTLSKQRKLIKTALCYLQEQHLPENQVCRFDVAAITSGGDKLQISWIKDAFQLE